MDDNAVCSPHHEQTGAVSHMTRRMALHAATSLCVLSPVTPSIIISVSCLSAQPTGGVVCLVQSGMRSAVASGPGGAPTLDGNRKLAVINGMGDHSRAQGNSSAVKEAIGACRL